jgi:hypothetical protein
VTVGPKILLSNRRNWFVTVAGQGDLWAVNLTTGEKRLLRSNIAARKIVQSGHWVVWVNDLKAAGGTPLPNGGSQLFVLDLSSGTVRCLPAEVSVWGLALDGDELCFQQVVSDAESRIFVSDLARGTTKYIGEAGQLNSDPAIAGFWVAWADATSQKVVVANTQDGKRFSLASEGPPLLSKTWLIWPGSAKTIGPQKGWSLHARDLRTGRTHLVADFATPLFDADSVAALRAPWLVWGGERKLEALDLDSGTAIDLMANDRYFQTVLFCGDWIVHSGWGGGIGIVATDTKTGRVVQLTRSNIINGPWLVGSWVVWSGSQGEVTVFQAHDLASGKTMSFSL